jgi:hypothetical protein
MTFEQTKQIYDEANQALAALTDSITDEVMITKGYSRGDANSYAVGYLRSFLVGCIADLSKRDRVKIIAGMNDRIKIINERIEDYNEHQVTDEDLDQSQVYCEDE